MLFDLVSTKGVVSSKERGTNHYYGFMRVVYRAGRQRLFQIKTSVETYKKLPDT